MYAKIKNSYDRNESMNTKVYHKKELSFFVHTEARFSYRKICPCFCGVTVLCYWYNFSNLGRRDGVREDTALALNFTLNSISLCRII